MMKMSQADLADRITILELKLKEGLPVYAELSLYLWECEAPAELVDQLRAVNADGWHWVGIITDHFEGRRCVPDDILLNACRLAHDSNKARIALKNEISRAFGDCIESKTWAGANDGSSVRTGEVSANA